MDEQLLYVVFGSWVYAHTYAFNRGIPQHRAVSVVADPKLTALSSFEGRVVVVDVEFYRPEGLVEEWAQIAARVRAHNEARGHDTKVVHIGR